MSHPGFIGRRARLKRYKDKHIEQGLCISCSKKSVKGTHRCKYHKMKSMESNKRNRDKRFQEGEEVIRQIIFDIMQNSKGNRKTQLESDSYSDFLKRQYIKMVKAGIKQGRQEVMVKLSLAKQCIDYQLINCKNADCKNLACPLNHHF